LDGNNFSIMPFIMRATLQTPLLFPSVAPCIYPMVLQYVSSLPVSQPPVIPSAVGNLYVSPNFGNLCHIAFTYKISNTDKDMKQLTKDRLTKHQSKELRERIAEMKCDEKATLAELKNV